MKIGFVTIVNSFEYRKLLKEKERLIRVNEQMQIRLSLLENNLEASRQKVMENHKVFCYLSDFYYTVQDSMEKIYSTMKEYGGRR